MAIATINPATPAARKTAQAGDPTIRTARL